METGTISGEQYAVLMQSIYLAGLRGVTFTGGEPMMNKDWPELVHEASRLGFERIAMTTNGMLLLTYLNKNDKLPEELTLLKVSLDTHDSDTFNRVTRVGDLNRVAEGVKRVKQTNPDLRVRANKVLLRSQLSELREYIGFVENIGFDELIFLDLILTDSKPETIAAFEREYVYIQELLTELRGIYSEELVIEDSRYGYTLSLPSGLTVLLKDSNNVTLRDEDCFTCPIPCQEGLFAARVSTDGAVRLCFDTTNQLPYVDGRKLLVEGSQDQLNAGINQLMARMAAADETDFFATFLEMAGADLPSYES